MKTRVDILYASGYVVTYDFRYHQAALDAYHTIQTIIGQDKVYHGHDDKVNFAVRGTNIDQVVLR